MNLLQSLYCNQYLELKQQGKESAANKNGNVIATVSLFCNVVTVLMLLSVLSNFFADYMGDAIRNVFHGSSGRMVGRLIAIIGLALTFPIVKFTVGKKEYFDKTIATFEALPEAEQKAASKRGLIYFFGSIGAAIVSGLLLAL
jgi:hypothetical protein